MSQAVESVVAPVEPAGAPAAPEPSPEAAREAQLREARQLFSQVANGVPAATPDAPAEPAEAAPDPKPEAAPAAPEPFG